MKLAPRRGASPAAAIASRSHIRRGRMNTIEVPTVIEDPYVQTHRNFRLEQFQGPQMFTLVNLIYTRISWASIVLEGVPTCKPNQLICSEDQATSIYEVDLTKSVRRGTL